MNKNKTKQTSNSTLSIIMTTKKKKNLIHSFHIPSGATCGPSSSCCLFLLGHKNANQASRQHALIVHPGMYLAKQLGPVPARAPQELRLPAGVERQIGADVVHAPVEHGPGVLALPARHLLEHRGRDAQVRGAGRQAAQVGVGARREAGPVEWGVSRGEDDGSGGLCRLGGVGWGRGEG